MRAAAERVVLLGPQRRPTVDQVVASLEVDGPIATVNAGWQEREADDGELDALLGGRTLNLALHRRWLDVLDRDTELRVAVNEHRSSLDDLQQLYLVQLDAALGAVGAVSRHSDARPRMRAAALADAETAVRLLDAHHLARVARADADFADAWRPEDRPVVAEHRAQVRRAVEQAPALVVTGGHVGVLLRVMRVFGLADALPGTVVAWSAGAMAMTDRVLLFHDRAPHGPAHPEFLDAGLGVVHDLVLLPHARRRLRLDDAARMGVLARRVAPAQCVVLDDGARVDLDSGTLPPGTPVVEPDGHLGLVGQP